MLTTTTPTTPTLPASLKRKRSSKFDELTGRVIKRRRTYGIFGNTTETCNRTKLTDDSWIDSGTLPKELMDKISSFDTLWNLHPEEKGKIMTPKGIVITPRWVQSYGNDYKFTGLNHKAKKHMPPSIQILLDWVNTLPYAKEHLFNQVLINWYANGHHYIGAHSDNEKQFHDNAPIVSISLGASRNFRIRKIKKKGIKGSSPVIKNILVSNKSLLIMGGKMQKEFTHEIVKIGGKKGDKTGSRINITFRQFKII